MKARKVILILVLTSGVILACFLLFNLKNTAKDIFSLNGTFNIEQFQSAMKAKNYNFEMKDADEDFLPTTRKRMIIGKEVLDIYLFSSNKQMEKEAKYIHSDGSGYDNGSKGVEVEWIAPPHFYKSGSIIVQYVGDNEKIISDLKDILGNQFAGQIMGVVQ